MPKKWDAISLGIFLISAFVITSLITEAPEDVPPVCAEGYVLNEANQMCFLPVTCPDGYVLEEGSQMCIQVITKTGTTPAPIITEGCPEGEYVDPLGVCKPITQGTGTGGGGGGGALFMSVIPTDVGGLSVLFFVLVFMVGNWYIWGRKLFS